MYYGISQVQYGEAAADVWSNGYLAVWHLHSGATDSTSGQHNGSVVGGVNAADQLGNGRVFGGVG